jgi:predicted transposase/invertase (TIGR01784 family)
MPKEAPILSLKNDFMFKGALGVRECKVSLTAFLRALCPRLPKEDFDEITFPDTHRKRRHKDDKECVLDVCVRLKSGRMIAIEIQLAPKPGACNRAQFINAKMMVEQLKKGDQYVDMPQVITIFILDHVLFKGKKKYRHEYLVMDSEDGDELPNSQIFLFIELPKVPKKSDGTAVWNWLRLFEVETPEELKALVKREPAMAETATKVLEMSANERNRLRAIGREIRQRDQEAILHEVRISREVGRAEGRAEERQEFARRLLRKKMPLAEVASLTGLSEVEVKRLRARK